jgi:cell wall-associated NlpC family hydrolase
MMTIVDRAGMTGKGFAAAVCMALSFSVILAIAAPAGAVPPPPPNPSDRQIQNSQSAAGSSAAQVGRLSGLLSVTQGEITRLNNDLELKGELVLKAGIDLQLAQSNVITAQQQAQAALRTADAASGAISDAQRKAARFAAASFRQGSVLGSVTALIDSSSAADLIARQELLTAVSKSQLDVIGRLQSSLSDKANLDSDARVARDRATAAQGAAVAAEKTAEQARQSAGDAFVLGKAHLVQLNGQLDQQENDYQLALSKVADLQNQRAQYNQWRAVKKAEEQRLRLAAIARAKAFAAAQLAAEKLAAHNAAVQAAAQASAAAAERARLQAAAQAAARAAAAQAAAAQVAAQNAARIAKTRYDYQQAQLRAQAAARTAAEAAAAAAAAGNAQHTDPGVYYATCADAVAAGVTPIKKGSPGYRLALDTNGNGLACEILNNPAPTDNPISNPVTSPTAPATPDPTATNSPPPPAAGGWSAAAGQAAVAAAERWVGTPYSWGGGDVSGPTLGICAGNGAENDCNVTGFDCSGLTLYAWGLQGVTLPHYSVYQYTLTRQIATADLLPGDLLFYATDTSNPSTIHHMAMYAGNGQMVQAPYSGAFVEISPVDFGNGFIGATRPGS